METQKAKKGVTPNKGTVSSYLQNFTIEAIDKIVEIMRESRMPQVQFAAAKLLIDKTIADVKAIEITGQNGEPIKYTIIAGDDYSAYVSKLNETIASSEGSIIRGLTPIQSLSVASQSEKNNDSNKSVS